MRVIVFFDLPMETSAEKRAYNRFRKMLLKSGFLMMQKSVYSKLALNQTAAKTIIEQVKNNKPKEGTVAVMVITEKQYSAIEYILGECSSDILNTDERLVEI